jgi:uncharacterized protein (DUF58 family)
LKGFFIFTQLENNISENNLLQTGNLELLAKQVVEGFITGLHKSPFHGFSVEFAEHRQYNAGESIKHIDWKLFGKTDKLFTKKYEEETNLRCFLVIDNSASMYFPFEGLSKINFATYAAACITYMLKKQRDAVGLSVINDEVSFQSAAKSSSVHLKMIFNELNKLNTNKDAKGGSNLSFGLHQIAENSHKRSLIIIFTDMFSTEKRELLFDALQHLKYCKHEVILFHVYDKKNELDFNFGNRPYLFTDSETGEKLKLFPHLVAQEYQGLFNSFKEEILLKCAQLKIDFIDTSIENNFDKILLTFLQKREKMK